MSFLPTSVSPRVELLLLTGFIIFTVADFDDCCSCFPSFFKQKNASKHHPILWCTQEKIYSVPNCGPYGLVDALDASKHEPNFPIQIHPTADSLLLVTGLWASLQNPSASAPFASLSLPTAFF